MTEYAEGSGSTWEDLGGDPRIVPGTEVLVGCFSRCARAGCTPNKKCHGTLGVRAAVIAVGAEVSSVKIGNEYWGKNTRDLVCLRTVFGDLTKEGRALELWADAIDDGTVYIEDTEYGQWGECAGILIYEGTNHIPYYSVDRRRLAMALGREEAKPAGVNVLPPYHGHPLHVPGKGLDLPNMPCVVAPIAPPAPVMCSRCGVQPASGDPRWCSLWCLDCCGEHFDPGSHETYPPKPSVDYSGVAHMDAIRGWLRRPMGTR